MGSEDERDPVRRGYDALSLRYRRDDAEEDQYGPRLAELHRRAGGWLLATVGHDSWTGVEEKWHGGAAPMWWSHADAATYRSWLQDAGLTITSEEFVPEGMSGHTLFWCQRQAASRVHLEGEA